MPRLRLQGFLKNKRTAHKNSKSAVKLFGMESKSKNAASFSFCEEIAFAFPNAEMASLAVKAIRPEMNKSFERRSKASIKTNKNVVLLKILAKDEHAVKASVSSYARLFGLVEKILR